MEYTVSDAPVLNGLPSDLHDITDISTFRKQLIVYRFIVLSTDYCMALLNILYSGTIQF